MDQNLKKVRQTVKIRQALDQLSSPDLPLSVNNNNMAINRVSSLNGNNRFINQNNFQNYYPPSTSPFQQERSNIITDPGQTPIIEPIIPPVTRTTPSKQIAPAPAPQEQEQKNEIIRPLNTCKTMSFIIQSSSHKIF